MEGEKSIKATGAEGRNADKTGRVMERAEGGRGQMAWQVPGFGLWLGQNRGTRL